MKFLLSTIALSLLFSCSSTTKNSNSDLNKLVSEYESSAKTLLENNNQKSRKNTIIKNANDLIAKAKPILIAFKNKNPQCSELLTAIMNSDKKMGLLTLEQIEEQYHEGSALPKADDLCFEAKELIVHPATVIVISKNYKLSKDQRTQINDEIEEVLGHLDLFKDNI
ncbi:hypothetical protein A9Q84_13865 [Halobacteriovorax marinus]|uniref:Lipoprotein n=1 Tax=Halobacteriovorax marinus TaxID=97084 RepID=A0A1Y5F8Y2_9BACT|nr:hypothetical protein A9Q84_13865 [Halobacteriovorax marinus]